MWIERFEQENFEKELDRLWMEIKPLYQFLHAFVRRSLIFRYPEQSAAFPSSGHIPAHLLGDLGGKSWKNLWFHQKLLKIWENVTPVNLTGLLHHAQYRTVKDIIPFVHGVYFQDLIASIGLHKSTYDNSIWTKPQGRPTFNCYPSAMAMFNAERNNYRIKICAEPNVESLQELVRLTGKVMYYEHMALAKLPILMSKPANPAFMHAMVDMLAFPFNTVAQFYSLTMVGDFTRSELSNYHLGQILANALDIIAGLPFAIALEKWRYQVFKGAVRPQDINRLWWLYRCKYQGISPPSERPVGAVDALGTFHVTANIMYAQYFLAPILQFQLFKGLCDRKMKKVALSICYMDTQHKVIMNKLIAELMQAGWGSHWKDTLRQFTQRENYYDTGPLREYFGTILRELITWKNKENLSIGWNENKCPNAPPAYDTSADNMGLASTESYSEGLPNQEAMESSEDSLLLKKYSTFPFIPIICSCIVFLTYSYEGPNL